MIIPIIIGMNSVYAEYCIESNGGTWHCFLDDYDSDDIDYSYRGADVTNDYWNNQKDEPNCYGEDYRCLNEDGSSKYHNYENYLDNGCPVDFPYLWSDDYCYDIPEDDLILNNGCYEDYPYLWSDNYCYSYPESDSSNYKYDNYVSNSICDSHVKYSIDKINFAVCDSKGNSYFWEMDRNVYDDMIINGNNLSIYNSENPIYLVNDDGLEFTAIGLDGFVYGAFESIIDDVYNNSNSDSDFIYEVWYIVSEITEYGSDRDDGYYMGDEGRYALDTLARGGGDCEDLVILVADMLVSSKYTKDWDIQYIYIDGDNPTNPETTNHVILYVDDGTYSYYIEATNSPRWDYYPNGIIGWYFDV